MNMWKKLLSGAAACALCACGSSPVAKDLPEQSYVQEHTSAETSQQLKGASAEKLKEKWGAPASEENGVLRYALADGKAVLVTASDNKITGVSYEYENAELPYTLELFEDSPIFDGTARKVYNITVKNETPDTYRNVTVRLKLTGNILGTFQGTRDGDTLVLNSGVPVGPYGTYTIRNITLHGQGEYGIE